MRARIAVVAAVAALGSAGAAMAFSSAATPTLKGTVGPGFTITLKDSSGHKVKTLKAGKYKIVIADKADIHTFDLVQKTGGKFHKELTGSSFTGKKTVTVKLSKGKWQYYCAVHPTDKAEPSRTDVENIGLWQGKPYLILSRPTGELRGWRITGGKVEEVEIE